jgi:nucleoside-diphosphate-sugar epimerase
MPGQPGRVFITGCLGFIGRALAARYRELGSEVRGVDLRADPDLDVVAGDIAAPGPWQRHADGCDLVIHTAALVSLRRRPADDFWRVNVMGTRNALDAAARGGAGRFVHISSVTVFSFRFPDGVDETYPVRCNGVPYVDTKVAGEQLVLQAHAEGVVPCTIIRPADVWGPGSRPWTILPVEEIRQSRFVLPAMGRGIFSPVYIDNLVDGIALAASPPDAAGHVFTLSDGIGIETSDFFGRYQEMLGKPRVMRAPTVAVRALAEVVDFAARLTGADNEVTGSAVDYLARTGTYSIEKARSMLGYRPTTDLDAGMARTEAWLRAEGLLG